MNFDRNVNFNDVDNGGNSPLHIAVKYGRVKNAEVLLRTAKEKAELNDVDNQAIYEKFGLASINLMNKSRYCPLHLAALNNHLVSKHFFDQKNLDFLFRIVLKYFSNLVHVLMYLRGSLLKNEHH